MLSLRVEGVNLCTNSGERTTSRPGRFTPGKEAGTHLIGGWLGPRSNLDDLEKRKISVVSGIPNP
jgi:hypothetical protein